MAQAQLITRATHGDSLADILERVLNTGVVIVGDIKIKLCDVELLSIQLRLLICSVEKAQELGIPWWWEQRAPADRDKTISKTADSPQLAFPNTGSEAHMHWEQYKKFQEFQQFQNAMHAGE